MRLVVLFLLLACISISYLKALQSKRYDFIRQRPTIDTLQQEMGVVHNVGNTMMPVYVIYCQRQRLNLFPCNLPASFRKINKQVIVSGNMKDMQLLEHEYGQYFEITGIR